MHTRSRHNSCRNVSRLYVRLLFLVYFCALAGGVDRALVAPLPHLWAASLRCLMTHRWTRHYCCSSYPTHVTQPAMDHWPNGYLCHMFSSSGLVVCLSVAATDNMVSLPMASASVVRVYFYVPTHKAGTINLLSDCLSIYLSA